MVQQIGAISKASGVPIKTIRYYEELGLLQSVERTEAGYRLFGSDVLSRLQFIKRAQRLGLSLADIKTFLDVHDQGHLPCDQVRTKLQEKIVEIDRQLEQLHILKQELQELLAASASSPSDRATICPILQPDSGLDQDSSIG